LREKTKKKTKGSKIEMASPHTGNQREGEIVIHKKNVITSGGRAQE